MRGAARGHQPVTWLLLAFFLFLVYGSLFPFSGWTPPPHGLGSVLQPPGHRWVSRADYLTNLILYVPFGLLAVLTLRRRVGAPLAWLLAAVGGAATSLALEVAQAWLPTRVSSLSDLVLNGVGAAVGASAALAIGPESASLAAVGRLRERWLPPGRLPVLGVATLGLWAVTELSPFVPSLRLGDLRAGLRPLKAWALGARPLDPWRAGTWVLDAFAVCGVAALCLRGDRPRLGAASALVGAVIALKVPVIHQQLTPEALLGAAVGLGAARAVLRGSARRLEVATAAALLAAYVVSQLTPGQGFAARGPGSMNWIPFGASELDVFDVADLVGGAWPCWGLCYLVRRRVRDDRRWAVAGGAAVGVLALALEGAQVAIPGRVGDVTDALAALAGWALPWAWRVSGDAEAVASDE